MGEKWMKEVADAGGWDEHALAVLKEIKSIKKEQWEGIEDNLKTLKGFIDMNAQGVLNSFTESLSTTIQLKFEEVLAPLKNEWNDLINTLLEPLMPMLQDLVTFLVPIVQTIADGVAWIMATLARLNIPALTPPAAPGVMMTRAQFEAWYVMKYPLATIMPGQMDYEYAQYVANWIAEHQPYERIGGLKI